MDKLNPNNWILPSIVKLISKYLTPDWYRSLIVLSNLERTIIYCFLTYFMVFGFEHDNDNHERKSIG